MWDRAEEAAAGAQVLWAEGGRTTRQALGHCHAFTTSILDSSCGPRKALWGLGNTVFLEARIGIERGWGRQRIIEAWTYQAAVTAGPISGMQMLIDLQFSGSHLSQPWGPWW